MIIDRSVFYPILAVIGTLFVCGMFWVHHHDNDVIEQPYVPSHIIMGTRVPCPQVPNPLFANGTDCA